MAVAAVASVGDDGDPVVFSAVPAQKVGGPVTRRIVDDDQLKVAKCRSGSSATESQWQRDVRSTPNSDGIVASH